MQPLMRAGINRPISLARSRASKRVGGLRGRGWGGGVLVKDVEVAAK